MACSVASNGYQRGTGCVAGDVSPAAHLANASVMRSTDGTSARAQHPVLHTTSLSRTAPTPLRNSETRVSVAGSQPSDRRCWCPSTQWSCFSRRLFAVVSAGGCCQRGSAPLGSPARPAVGIVEMGTPSVSARLAVDRGGRTSLDRGLAITTASNTREERAVGEQPPSDNNSE